MKNSPRFIIQKAIVVNTGKQYGNEEFLSGGGSGAMMYTEGKVYEEGLAAVVL